MDVRAISLLRWASVGRQEECDDGNGDTSDQFSDRPNGTGKWAYCDHGFLWTDQEECDDGGHRPFVMRTALW